MPRETKAQREAREAAEKLEAEKAADEAAGQEDHGEGEPPQPSEASSPSKPPEAEPSVIHIIVDRAPDGSVEVDVGTAGDIRVTEISDLIILGYKKWKIKSGLKFD